MDRRGNDLVTIHVLSYTIPNHSLSAVKKLMIKNERYVT